MRRRPIVPPSARANANLSRPRRRILQGIGATTAATAMNLPFATRAFGKEDHPLAGRKIDMSVLGIAGWLPSSLGVNMSPMFNDYVKERYGYEVEFSFAEAPFSDLFQKAATSLATRSQEYNIIISDSQWIGALAEPGWILPMNDVIANSPNLKNLEWYSDTVPNTYMTYPDGSQDYWGLPQEGDTIALFLRKDMLSDPAEQEAFEKAYGMPLPQTFEEYEALTMEDFEKVAEHFTRPDDGIWGTAMQYSRVYDFCTCQLYPFMWSTGGEVWDAETGQVEGILNTEGNALAMERMKDLMKYQPPGRENYGIGEIIDVFTQGKVFSAFQWAAVGLAMITDEMKENDQVLVVVPPKHGTGEAADRIYTMGGQPWVINAFNDEAHMRVALDFMDWWYLPETALEFARRGGNPCDKPTLTSDGFDDINPWNRAYKAMLEPGVSRDFWHHPKYAEMLAVQQEAFTSYMTGQTESAMQALTYAACSQQQILMDYGTTQTMPGGECGVIEL